MFPKGASPYVVTLPSARVLRSVRGDTLWLTDTDDAFVIHVLVVRQSLDDLGTCGTLALPEAAGYRHLHVTHW